MTEQKIVHTQNTLPEAAVAVSSIVSITDTEGYITWVNDHFCRICRCTADELIGKRHSILENLLQAEGQSDSILNTIQKGESWQGELQYLVAEGIPIRTYSTIVPMRGAAGKISQYIIIFEEITGRKTAAETLIVFEKRFQNLLGNDTNAAFITDLEGKILKAIKGGESVVNLPQGALQGMRFLDLLSAGDQQKISAALPLVLEGQDLQFRAVLNKFGTAFSAVVAITPVLEEGKTSHFFVRFQNISTEDDIEKGLKLLNEITQALSAAPSLKRGMALVIAELCAYGNFQYGEFWRPLFNQPLVSMKSCWGVTDKFQPLKAATKGRVFDILADRSEILNNSKCFYAADLGTYKNFSRKAEATACGLHSLLSIPIIYREKLQGIFLLFSARKHHQPSVDPDRLQALLSTLGGELERNKINVELDRFFDLSPELMSIIGFDGYTKKSNLAFRHLHGYSDKETESSMAMSFVHPDDLPKAAGAWQKIIQGHPVRNLELRYRCKDGSYRWLSCAIQSFPEDRLLYLTACDITDEKLQIQELEVIKLAVENTSDAIGIASDMDHTVYLNNSFDKLLGWTIDELSVIGWTSMFVEPRLPYDIVEILIEKGCWEGDVEMYHRNGYILDINLRANATLNSDGTPRYLIGVYRDITEQKKAQQELVKLSTAIRHSINEVYIISPDNGHFSYMNERALNNLGYTPAEIKTLTPLKINPDYAQFSYRKMFAQLIKDCKRSMNFQAFHTRKDGSSYPVEIYLSTFQFKDQRSIMASVVDISERLQAEEALRISNERYQLVTRATHDAIWDVALDKQIYYYGEGFRTIFGHDYGNSFAGMEVWSDKIHPEDAERVIANVYEALSSSSKEWVIEYRFRCFDGSYKFVKDRGYVIYNNAGEAIRMTGAMADITDQKQSEQLLREFNAALERKVDEKTASLAQALHIMRQEERARIKTEEVLQQSLKEKEVLNNEIHHRVKNNLAIISGLLSLQARLVDNETLRGILKDSQSRIKSMALIHEMLYQHENLARINFREYIEQLTAGISGSFQFTDKKVNIIIRAEAVELDIIHAIPCGLILNELITNSYKYAFADRDQGEICIGFHKLNDVYELRIADNGLGLPEGFSTRKAKSLGMQLIGSLVRQIGGEIAIKNKQGACFTIHWK